MPNVIGIFIDETHGGQIIPEQLLSAANDPTSKLHKYFEWDDKKCGRLYRFEQARNIITSIYIESDDHKPMRQFLRVNIGSGSTYTSVDQIQNSADFIDQVIATAFDQLNRWKDRYARYCDYFGITQDGDKTKITISMKGKLNEKDKGTSGREESINTRNQRQIRAIGDNRNISTPRP